MRTAGGAAAALLVLAGILTATHFGPAWAASPLTRYDDQGTFLISLAGAPLGTEKFTIQASDDHLVAQADIHLKIMQGQLPVELETFPKLVLDSHFRPQTYSWHLKGPESYQLDVDFRTPPARSRLRLGGKKEDVRTFQLPPDVVILDNNVIHHYQLLLDRYYTTSKRNQTFSGYIPQDALPGVLTVEDVGPQVIQLHGAETTLEHVVVTADNARLDLWVDGQHRLQRLSDPTKAMEAIRQ
jgi:hypothetical protein